MRHADGDNKRLSTARLSDSIRSLVWTPLSALRSRLFRSPRGIHNASSMESLDELFVDSHSTPTDAATSDQRAANQGGSEHMVDSGSAHNVQGDTSVGVDPVEMSAYDSSQTIPMQLLLPNRRGVSASEARKRRSLRCQRPTVPANLMLSPRRSRRLAQSTQQADQEPSLVDLVANKSSTDPTTTPAKKTPAKKAKGKKAPKGNKKTEIQTCQLRCGLCMTWHKTTETEPGAWVCQSCRQLPAAVATISQQLTGLNATIAANQVTLVDLVKQLAAKTSQCEELVAENNELKRRLTSRREEPAAVQTSRSPRRPVLLLGSSIIRDAGKCGLPSDVDVISLSGAKIQEVHNHLNELTTKYDQVVLAVGGNDCSRKSANVQDIASDYKQLLKGARSVGSQVKVASILPRTTEDGKVWETIQTVNCCLEELCHTETVSFVNNNTNFTLGDGSINDALLTPDGVHLTRLGTKKLLQNLGFKLASPVQHSKGEQNTKGPRQDNSGGANRWETVNRQQKRRGPARKPQNTGHQEQHGRNSNYQGKSNGLRCYNCGDAHATADCPHSTRVTCHGCGRLGHKRYACRG